MSSHLNQIFFRIRATLYKTDTSIRRTLILVPMVSVLERVDCNLIAKNNCLYVIKNQLNSQTGFKLKKKHYTLAKEVLAKFYLSWTFGLSFMISSVTPTRSSTFYAYLITKIGNRNLNVLSFHPVTQISHFMCFNYHKSTECILKISLDISLTCL